MSTASETKRKATVQALINELRRIATQQELEEAIGGIPIQPRQKKEAIMTEDEEKSVKKGAVASGVSRSADGVKLGVAMFGVDKVGKGAMSIAKRPFPQGSKTREFLETDEGRHLVLGIAAFMANIAAESEKVPLDPDNIGWITQALIANSTLGLANSAADASMDKIMQSGMELWQFVLGLKQPESMADIIEMTKGLEVEDVELDAASDEVELNTAVETKQEA